MTGTMTTTTCEECARTEECAERLGPERGVRGGRERREDRRFMCERVCANGMRMRGGSALHVSGVARASVGAMEVWRYTF